MESKKIYRRLTENIQNKITKYKEGKSTKDHLNDQLIINISSLCRFLQKREEEKIQEQLEKQKRDLEKIKLKSQKERLLKQIMEQERKEKKEKKSLKKNNKSEKLKISEELQKLKNSKIEIDNKIKKIEDEDENDLNQTILDVFVPYSRLTKLMQLKLESLNNEIIEEEDGNDFFVDENGLNLENSMDHEKIANLIADEDDEIIDPVSDLQNDYLNNDNLSISMSLFNKPLEDPFLMNSHSSINNLKKQKTVDNENSLVFENNNNNNKDNNNNLKNDVNKNEQLKMAMDAFNDIIKPKQIKEVIYDMSYDYLIYMYHIYKKMKEKSDDVEDESSQTKSLNFINQFKAFVLDIGISDKKFYEQCIREIIYNKNELEFGEFLECFKKLINLKFDQTFLKYKFLFHITERENEEYFKKEELDNYFNMLLKCKKIYEPEIYEDIKNKLVAKYKKIFPGNNKVYNTRKLSLVLENFFDLK